ncbi:MAG: phage tail sheath C-terminal domain-containing protein [Gammaproteobacteria bacterium]|nr:phage tail sheath C-terminal domain-containing protein [Gammaproteobacteria bacterium]
MPISPTYPGVYIEEVPSGVRTITGVATSITAFVGRTLKGETNEPIRIQSFSDYGRVFGGLWAESTLSYAVQHYFQHGGNDAIIVRVFNGDEETNTSTINFPPNALVLMASSPGLWGNSLRVFVNHDTRDADLPLADQDTSLFNLIINEIDTDTGNILSTETFLNVSANEDSPRFVTNVLDQQSSLVRVATPPIGRPAPSDSDVDGNLVPAEGAGGGDSNAIDDNDIADDVGDTNNTGMYALRRADLFNLLCIPPLEFDVDVDPGTFARAATFCNAERAIVLIDPNLTWVDVDTAESGVNELRSTVGTNNAINAFVYFPRIKLTDPLRENQIREFAPCGAVAGIIARTDSQRGVWKAAAGLDASFSGVRGVSFKLTDDENGRLNPLGLNCIRSFPVFGNVVWGARTLAGANALASEWKYAPVRRLALFLEESLYRGSQWVVFEPNDEPLWAQIRLNVGAFMQNLFRQGAFQGTTPRDAYLVKCDRETTTQNDINNGIVNIVVGFAPLKPAEFVIIKIQQLAGQIQT